MVGNNQHLLNVSPEEFEEEARKVLRLPTGADKMSASTEKREFRSSFGVTFEVCSDAWRRLEPKRRISKFAEPKHLLWAFVFLAVNGSEPVNCRLVGTGDRKSFRYWSWLFVEKISNLESEVIVWENRFKDWDGGSPCLVTIDGTDCRIQEPVPYNPIWWSHKFNGPALKYELGVCIKTGDIVWIGGPWPAAVQDREVFDEALADLLIPGEKVEADSGYNGRETIATPGMGTSHRQRKMKSQARGRQENVNGRAKMFNILTNTWRYDLEKHRMVMGAIVVLLQLSFEHGQRLYSVDFDNVNYD